MTPADKLTDDDLAIVILSQVLEQFRENIGVPRLSAVLMIASVKLLIDAYGIEEGWPHVRFAVDTILETARLAAYPRLKAI